MAHSIYSHKNRKYKPLVKKGMKEILSFYNKLESLYERGTSYDLISLSPEIESFGDWISVLIEPEKENGLSNYCYRELGERRLWVAFLVVGKIKFRISRQKIKQIYKTLRKFKDGIIDQTGSNKSNNYFLFLGEHREISSNIIDELNFLSVDQLEQLAEATRLPSQFFEKSAINAIKEGDNDFPTEEGVSVFSSSKFHYIIIPTSDHGYAILQNVYGRSEGLKQSIKFNNYEAFAKWKVPSILNKELSGEEELSQVIIRLIIQYYISFGGFGDITTCKMCNNLTFINKKGENICASPTCRWKLWRDNNPRDYEKTKCRNKQNKWVRENTGQNHLGKSPDFCVDCKLEDFPPGGKCPGIVGKYDELIAEHNEEKMAQKEGKKSTIGKGSSHLEGTNVSTPKDM